MSAASRFSAHNAANEVLSRWFDVKSKDKVQSITVYDESHEQVFRDADIKKIGRLSTLIAFPTQQEDLRATLAA